MKHLTAVLTLLICVSVNGQSKHAFYVDPFIGTGGHGHTFPGATAPFGMVQLSPDTRVDGSWDGCSGYHYSDDFIYGFSHTHLSGTGVSDYGDVLLMPYLGDETLDPLQYGSTFNHDSEEAIAGFYRVTLEDRIEVELTASTRVGYHKYAFPQFKESKERANVMLDLRHRDNLLEGEIIVVNDTMIIGKRVSKAWAREQHVYFAIVSSKPFTPGLEHRDPETNLPIAMNLRFGKIKSSEPLYLQVGLSFSSMDGAIKNLSETSGKSFDQTMMETHELWNNELSKIQITAHEDDPRYSTFYTALYHTMIHPNVATDVDGTYRGHDMQLHKAEGYTQYTVFSLWDTFRATHPLYNLIQRDRSLDFVKSMLAIYDQGGRLPVWELCSNETDCMIGYHSASVIADAYAKGIRGFDANKALEAMVKSSTWNHLGVPAFDKNGLITIDDEHESVSKTLEYAYDDWCIYTLASQLNKKEIAERYLERSQFWKNTFDPTTGFMRPRRNGGWLEPFDPTEVNNHFTEANSWQYSFFVPHDVSGLVDAFGGVEPFEKQLDALFEASSATSGRHQVDITGLIGQYAHGNEPSHHMAYLYNYINKPEKTRNRIHQVLDLLYTNTPDGLSGNEDCGQMSAWYVMSSIGMYPVCPGSDVYALSTPIFEEVSVSLEDGQPPFTIRSQGNHPYLNGQPWQHFIRHGDLTPGAELTFSHDAPQRVPYRFDPLPIVSGSDRIVPVPHFESKPLSFVDSMQVVIHPPDHPGYRTSEVYYRFIGDSINPEKPWQRYKGPFTIRSSPQIQAKSVLQGKESGIVQAEYVKKPNDYTIKILSEYNPQYTAGGPEGLIDGISGDENWRKGGWQGYQDQDFMAVIDLQETKTIRHVEAAFLQDQRAWIFYPKQVVFEYSKDGVNWSNYGEHTPNVSRDEDNVTLNSFATELAPAPRGRYIRVSATNFGALPDWHPGRGNPAFIFIDEIKVE